MIMLTINADKNDTIAPPIIPFVASEVMVFLFEGAIAEIPTEQMAIELMFANPQSEMAITVCALTDNNSIMLDKLLKATNSFNTIFCPSN